jgi:excinuclease ABC subunit B
LHSDIDTVQRMELIRQLRSGQFDVLIGINLLREGLDLPEVGLVAILDGDKEGFLRDTRSLIQTIGRASRNVEGRAIIYADKMTGSIDAAIKETNRRREKQMEYNKKHNITPQTIKKKLQESLAEIKEEQPTPQRAFQKILHASIELANDEEELFRTLEQAMFDAAKKLEFEIAASLRDIITEIKKGSYSLEKVKAKLETAQIKIPQINPEPNDDFLMADITGFQLLGTMEHVNVRAIKERIKEKQKKKQSPSEG